MFLFHESGCFDTGSEDIDVLARQLESLKHLRGLQCEKSYANLLDRLQTAILSNCCAARASSLLYMRQMDEINFFNPPVLSDLFRDVTDVPEKILRHISAQFSAWWTQELLVLMRDHDRFADLIMKFFARDMSLILVFSYSTFPAIFGFFTMQEMVPLGARLIQSILKKDVKGERNVVAMSMIASFFLCMHQFFDLLWDYFLKRVCELETRTNESCCEILYAGFEKFACLLTGDHITVITVIVSRSLEQGCELLFRDILAASLRIRGGSWISDFVTFLQTCSKRPETRHFRTKFLEMVTMYRVYIPSLPKCPPFSWAKTLRFAMSDVDIITIQEIYEMDTNPSYGTKKVMACHVNDYGYSPFYVEVPWLKSSCKKSPMLSAQNMCHKTDCENLKRKLAPMGVDILRCLKGTMFCCNGLDLELPACCSDPEFQKFVIREELEQCLVNEESVVDVVAIQDLINQFNHAREWVLGRNVALLERLAEAHVQERISKIPRKKLNDESIHKILTGWLGQSEREMGLYVLASLLDAFGTVKLQIPALTESFLKSVCPLVDKNAHEWADRHPALVRHIKPITRIVKAMLNVPVPGTQIGTRFKVLVHLVESLHTADSFLMQESRESQFQSMFEFCLCEAKPEGEDFCALMIICHRFIGADQGVKSLLSHEHGEQTSLLFAAFQNVLAYDYLVCQSFAKYIDDGLKGVVFSKSSKH